MEKKFSLPECGLEVVLGKFASQADGAAWLQQGGTVVFAAVVSAPSAEFPGFLPLSVDYREQFSAAGKIPGGYFKREGKMSDKEVLTSRLIDRAIRPLFPENYFDAVQVSSTVYSVDKEHVPNALAMLATSIALTTSKIPFIEPVGVAEVVRCDGNWLVNPTYSQIQVSSSIKITVAGTEEGICMVEGLADEISEKELVDILFLAHDVIKKQVAWQKQIQKELAIVKAPIVEQFDIATWQQRAKKVLTDDLVRGMFTNDKVTRSAVQSSLQKIFFDAYVTEVASENISKTFLGYIFDTVLRDKVTELCFVVNNRVDTRAFTQVRPIATEVGLLPFTHGSALFTRGRTQALVTVTLGGGQDEARSDDIMATKIESAFMLHYNFPSFSVGEVRPNRGPGRREIGHGYLAASALSAVLPSKEEFPYTIRIVADMLESDGSTSMATTCGSTMALMNAGVPIKKMVSGIAMGLLQSNTGKFQVLTDIAGIEDAYGLMDFKVTGTEQGITAIQMDIKYKGGLAREVFEAALAQAKDGRLHIMKEMQKVMTAPNPKLSDLVPLIVSFKIPTDKIGAVIGSGGKIIRDIIDKTGTTIDIEDDGLVKIFGHPGEKLDQAVSWVKTLGGQIEKGTRYPGIIKRVADFGLFVEIAPGLDGLVHISMIPRADQEYFMRTVEIGSQLPVEVVDYEVETGRIRLKLV